MIEFRSVGFEYQGAESPVLSRASFKADAGEFVLVCGPTGSGKSTLLKLINGLAPHFTGGLASGEIWIDERNITGSHPHELAELVGYVNQQPEGSFVADTVAEELAYGLEQLGFAPAEMEQRVTRFAKAVAIEHLLERPLANLSGGQQQRVAIAASLAAGQRVLVLDEPTSALDPKAAAEVLHLLHELSRSHGITVLLAEHRLERVLDLVDSVIVVNGDGSVVKSAPQNAFKDYRLVPPTVELGLRLNSPTALLSVEQAKGNIKRNLRFEPLEVQVANPEVALKVESLCVDYADNRAVNNISFELHKGEVLAIMGQNGSGKSSLLWAIQGSGKRTSGDATTEIGETSSLANEERLSALTLVPQRAADLLFLTSIREELEESDRFAKVAPGETAKLFLSLTNRTDPKQHPRDISAGQQLALVLALQLVKGAPVILLDEPTRGLDYEAKRHLAATIANLRAAGKSVLIASHDIEFVAQVASRVIVLDGGNLVADGLVSEVLGHEGLLPTQVAEACQTHGLLLARQVVAVA